MRFLPSLDSLYVDLPAARSGTLSAYGLAAGVVVMATLLRLALGRLEIGPFITFYPAIMLTAFLFGAPAGCFAIALSAASVWFFIFPASFVGGVTSGPGLVAIILFVLVDAGFVGMIGLMRRTLARLGELRVIDAAIFDADPDAVLVVAGDGRIIRVNKEAEILFGHPATAMVGQAVEMLVPDRFRSRHVGHRMTVMAERVPRDLGSGLGLFGLRADGTEFPADIKINPIPEWAGEARIIATIRDLTAENQAAQALAESLRQQAALEERQRGAEELRQTNEKLAKIIQAAPMAIYAIDSDTRVTMWNPAAEHILGVPAALAHDRSIVDLLGPRVPPGVPGPAAIIELAMERDGFTNLEIRRAANDGTDRELSLSAALLRDAEDKVVGILFVARDVGPAKEIERRLRQVQKIEAIGQLTAGIAHDFNNLLGIIHGNLELLHEHGGADPLVGEMTADALKAAKRGASLTHRLLAFSRQQQLAPSTVDVGAMMSSLTEMLRRLVEESVEIRTVIAPGLWTPRIDVQQLENALLNLAVNARDAMPDGGQLTIAAENAIVEQADGTDGVDIVAGHYVMVSIVDTGTGMSKAVVDRAFEPFFTTKPVGRGTGLGLSMVYGFVKQSGGHLSIDSEPGRGTKVTLFLPVLTGEADAQPAEPERPAPVADTGQVVLVVEDDELMREVQVRVLGSLGYRTLEAFDGASGLAALDQAGRVDLLLTDIGLPGGMSGPALAEAARRLRPDLEVIYMSGYAPNALIKQYGLSEGQILAKPFTRSALAHAVLERLEPGRST